MPQSDAQLLAIVEVDKAESVVCQASGCGHSVFRRIHVVRNGGQLGVYGSDCFGRLFHGLFKVGAPRYGTAEGRQLTPEERRMLAENTERLIAKFEEEQRQHLEQVRLRREQQVKLEPAALADGKKARPEAKRRRPLTPAEIASVEQRAKEMVRERYGVNNPDLPGWRGLVLEFARELLGK